MGSDVATVIVLLTASAIILKLFLRLVRVHPRNNVSAEPSPTEKREFPGENVEKSGQKGDESKYDAVIIGAGVVGATLALVLARQSRRILVLERQLGDHVDKKKIIGELLQPSGTDIIAKLGLKHILDRTLKSLVEGYRIFYDGQYRTLSLDYPLQNDEKPAEGYGFHNHLFVEELRKELSQYKNAELIEASAKSFLRGKDDSVTGVTYQRWSDDEFSEKIDSCTADMVFVCDGCFSNFRPKERTKSVTIDGYFFGLCMKDLVLKDPHKAILCIQKPTKMLIYPIGNNDVRILIEFKTKVSAKDLTKSFFGVYRDNLPEENIKEAFDVAVAKKEFRIMPNQTLTATKERPDGVMWVGDSLNMRHPITGSGMTVGLTDVLLLKKHLSADVFLSDRNEVRRRLKLFFAERQKENATLNILAAALNNVIDSENSDLIEGFTQYIAKGGLCVSGPMQLLSGISRQEDKLIFHFVNVGLLAAWNEMKGIPTPMKLFRAVSIVRKSVKIISPRVMKESGVWWIKGFVRTLSAVLWV